MMDSNGFNEIGKEIGGTYDRNIIHISSKLDFMRNEEIH